MSHQQLGLERVRMIEVDQMPLLGRIEVEVAVVRIVRDPLDPIFADAVVDGLGNGGLSRARASSDSNDHRCLHGPVCSSSSASVMKSDTSSAPQVLQITVASLPL